MEKIIDIFELGGPMMLPLALLAAAGALIFLERLLYLHKGQIRAVEFVAGIKTALKKRRLLEAVTICDESYGPIPRVVKAALLNSEEPPDTMSQAVNIAAANEFALIDRRVSSLALVAKLSPLLGWRGRFWRFCRYSAQWLSSGSVRERGGVFRPDLQRPAFERGGAFHRDSRVARVRADKQPRQGPCAGYRLVG